MKAVPIGDAFDNITTYGNHVLVDQHLSLKTAKAIGIGVPALLLRADGVIE